MKHSVKIVRMLMIAVCVVLVSTVGYTLETPNRVGVSPGGLTGIHRVGMPYDIAPAVHLSGSGLYGFTESIGPVGGGHHRLEGALGIGARIWPFLGVALNFTGRYDLHPDDGEGKDTSIIGDPRLLFRGGYPVSKDFHLGGELEFWIPGLDAPSLAWDATTVDVKLLAALVPEGGRFAIAGYAGFRINNSDNAAPNLERTRAGDRISLRLSDSHSVLLGFGASVPLSPFELLAEFSWDILVGDGAPKASESPIRLNLGARYYPLANLGIELLGEVGLSPRPGIGPTDPLVPIEPRVSVLVGLSYTFDLRKEGDSQQADTLDNVSDPAVEEVPLVSLTGRVTDENGDPVSGVDVALLATDYSETVQSDESGQYQFNDVPVGPAELKITGKGYKNFEQNIVIDKAMPELLESTLAPAPQDVQGSQLRGLVRAFNGKGVRAQIIIEPLGKKLKTDFEGFFEIDVPPGKYTVTIQAKRYKSQVRKVTVEENGVSIINVDLRYAR